jgi:hypothetical protein
LQQRRGACKFGPKLKRKNPDYRGPQVFSALLAGEVQVYFGPLPPFGTSRFSIPARLGCGRDADRVPQTLNRPRTDDEAAN